MSRSHNARSRRVSSRPESGGGITTAGFTLVELVLVLTLIGILAAVAGPRFFDRGTFDERAYFDELANAMRYAQKLAVASGCPVRMIVNATGYDLGQQSAAGGHCDSTDGGFATPVRLPDGQTLSGSVPAGITVVPSVTFLFRPTGDTSLGGDQTISVGGRTLTVVAASGLVTSP